jgi:hypothetical protein
MTIECYFSGCPFHSCNEPGQEGPFCYEEDCRATMNQVEAYEKERMEYLKKHTLESKP